MCYVQIAMAAVTLIAGAMEAKNQREAGDANKAISENNAKMAEVSAQDAAILGARESEKAAWRTRALIGSQRAAAAANNLDLDIGSPADLTMESAMFGGADQSAIATDAARKAWGFQSEALNYRNQGKLAKWQGHAQAKLTILNSIGQSMSYFGSMGGYQSASSGPTQSYIPTRPTMSVSNLSYGSLGANVSTPGWY